jgi:hypothetical protein
MCDSAFCFNQSRETEIGQMQFTVCVEQNVSQFDVTMKDSVLVRIVDSARHFGDYLRGLPHRHWRTAYHFIKLSAPRVKALQVTSTGPLANPKNF